MILAVASSGEGLDAQMDPRFGRCAYFVIVDTDTMQAETVPNPGTQMGSGAAVQAAQTIADSAVDGVVAGNYGPNASQALAAGGIRMFQASGMTVRQAVEAAVAGRLNEASGATAQAKSGMGGQQMPGGGMGGGAGMGRGMGGGMGRGMGAGGMGAGAGGYDPQAQQGGWGMAPGYDPQAQQGGWGMPPGYGPQAQQGGWGMPPGYGPQAQQGAWGMGAMGPMGPMAGPMGPMAPMQGDPEQMRQYYLSMLQPQAQMLEQQLQMLETQIEQFEQTEMPPQGMPGMAGPVAPGFDPEQARQYHLGMMRAQADMMRQELEFIQSQIDYLEGQGQGQ